jgi:hypothetical protein
VRENSSISSSRSKDERADEPGREEAMLILLRKAKEDNSAERKK